MNKIAGTHFNLLIDLRIAMAIMELPMRRMMNGKNIMTMETIHKVKTVWYVSLPTYGVSWFGTAYHEEV